MPCIRIHDMYYMQVCARCPFWTQTSVRMLRQPDVPMLNLTMSICAYSLCRNLLGISGIQLMDLMHYDAIGIKGGLCDSSFTLRCKEFLGKGQAKLTSLLVEDHTGLLPLETL